MVLITIAADEVNGLRACALGLYAVKADAVHRATNDYLVDHESVCALVRHRTEAHAVGLLIDQLGWHFLSDPRPVIVRGPAWLLTELFTSMLITRLESLTDLLTADESEVGLVLGTLSDRLEGAKVLVACLAEVNAQEQCRGSASQPANAINY